MTREELLQLIKEAKDGNRIELDLSGQQITALPPEIGQLTNLQILSLSGNRLTELPEEITQLTKLQSLSLDENQLTKFPNEISQLTNLQFLYLDGNQLTELPKEISQLINLRDLFIRENQLTELPDEFVNLKDLHFLVIDRNPLVELPKEIFQLKNLRTLSFDENQLNSVSEHILQLKNTEIYVFDGKDYEGIPAEIVASSKNGKELLDYYFQIRKGKGRELNEAKVLVVGQGSVGKTSLIKRLITGKYNPKENKTEGIDINKWVVRVNNRDVQLNVWDFGGQEIMHATHQFFLTKRSLYVLVLDSRIGVEENRVDYWLEKIKSFGGDSPVIVVGNKTDQHPLDVNRGGLSKKYPNIKAFYEISCETNKNIARLKEDLMEEVGKLGGIHAILPASWFEIKSELEKIKKNYIPYEDYLQICTDKGVGDEENQSRLIRLLHDLGIILNFSEEEWMQDTNVLNPEWVTEGVYRIINSTELIKNKGELTRTMLAKILDTREYPKRKHLFIVRMMQNFELCFDIKRNEKFLVPDLLAEEELDTGDWTDSLKLEYRYKVFFNSIITRFIVKMHDYISKQTYWRTGVVLVYKVGGEVKNRALVKADSGDRKISIYVDGNKDTRREFLSRIRATFEQIHGTFAKEFVEDNVFEKVPIPKHPEVVVDYKQLLRLENAGKEFVTPEGLIEEFRVKDLLNGIETKEERRERKEEIAKTDRSNLPARSLVQRKAELEPIKANIDGKVDIVWLIIRVGLAILILTGVYFLVKWIYENWEKLNPNLESAQIVWAIVIAIVLALIFWIFGGREKLRSVINRLDELRDEGMKGIAYKWKKFEIKEFREICKELDTSNKPKETAGK